MYSSETTRQQFIQHSLSFIFEYYRMQLNIVFTAYISSILCKLQEQSYYKKVKCGRIW